jgi:hypothetical protein
MHASLSAGYDIGRRQFAEAFEPETGSFRFAVAKLPRLDNLIWFPVLRRHDANGIFDAHEGDVTETSMSQKEFDAGLLSPVSLFLFEPPGAAGCKMSARGERDHHIPSLMQDGEHVSLNMIFRFIFSWLKVTGPSVNTMQPKSPPNLTRALARHQNSHWIPFREKGYQPADHSTSKNS